MVAPLIFTWYFAFMKNSSCPLLVVSSCQAGRLCSRPFQVSSATAKTCSRAAWGTGAGAGRNMRHSSSVQAPAVSADATRRDAAVAGPREFSWDDFDDLLGFLWNYGITIHYYYVLHRIITYYYIYYYDDCDSLGTYPQIAIFMGKVKTNPVDVEVNDSIIFRAGDASPGMTLQSWRWMPEPRKP